MYGFTLPPVGPAPNGSSLSGSGGKGGSGESENVELGTLLAGSGGRAGSGESENVEPDVLSTGPGGRAGSGESENVEPDVLRSFTTEEKYKTEIVETRGCNQSRMAKQDINPYNTKCLIMFYFIVHVYAVHSALATT